MAPKKGKKISLNEFLGDSTLGSWADEMDNLPSAPAMRSDDDQGRSNDRYGRRGDDFLSSRPDRSALPPREDLPLPTQPPYTAFVGNLAFDLTELELEEFFASSKTKSVKIIRDRDDKPKGFGYVEFEDLDGLKDALSKTGSSFSGRTIRVSVAEAPKERSGFGPNADDGKFDSPWRRDGPLPDLPSRDSSRRRFDGPRPEPLPSVSEGAGDWRANQRPRPAGEPETSTGSVRRKNIGFGADSSGVADREESWTMGSKFKPAEEKEPSHGGKFGSARGRGDMGPPRDPVPEESDWRNSSRPRPVGRNSTSPNNSTPPTPQMGRRKLELLPRTGTASNTPSPLSSPKIGPTPTSASSARSNPFGAAKPVDVSGREKEVAQRLEKDREITRERLSMSRTSSRTGVERPVTRTSSRTGVERPIITRTQTPPINATSTTSSAASAKSTASANVVRPSFSFANAAANKTSAQDKNADNTDTKTAESPETKATVEGVIEQLGEVTI